ncbi:MAG: helix-turn-helix domain-containing protein [Candidatus Cloacimonadaceae bacterium]|jgi:cytoskeletal protein RodZ|nr:helix-turn-helix domain-containing protein [Candidatus Cloacimonadota bacterium]
MEDLGAYLKELREEKNINYDQIYEDLHLREEQVRLMEENRFSELGYLGFARAMVYNYARYLEADIDEVMQKFNLLMPDNIKKIEPESQEGGKKILISPNLFWIIGIILIVIVLGTILWHAYSSGWLQMPDLFKSNSSDTSSVEKLTQQEEPIPQKDPIRERQKALMDSITKAQPIQKVPVPNDETTFIDTMDIVGEILGPSVMDISDR